MQLLCMYPHSSCQEIYLMLSCKIKSSLSHFNKAANTNTLFAKPHSLLYGSMLSNNLIGCTIKHRLLQRQMFKNLDKSKSKPNLINIIKDGKIKQLKSSNSVWFGFSKLTNANKEYLCWQSIKMQQKSIK